MSEHEPGWRGPAAFSEDNPDQKIFVTARRLEGILEQAHLDQEMLRGNKTLSVGNGLSDFVERTNEIGDGTFAVGVDPLYGSLSDSYDSFFRAMTDKNLEPHPDMLTPEVYEKFKRGVSENTYVAGTGEKLPFANETFDLVVAAHIVDNVGDDQLAENIILECLRTIQPHGELRIPEVSMIRSRSEGEMIMRIENFTFSSSVERYKKIFATLENEGFSIFSPRNIGTRFHQPGGIREYMKESGDRDAQSYEGIIIRKDDQAPEVIIYQDTSFGQTLEPGDFPVAKIHATGTLPDGFSCEDGHGKVTIKERPKS